MSSSITQTDFVSQGGDNGLSAAAVGRLLDWHLNVELIRIRNQAKGEEGALTKIPLRPGKAAAADWDAAFPKSQRELLGDFPADRIQPILDAYDLGVPSSEQEGRELVSYYLGRDK